MHVQFFCPLFYGVVFFLLISLNFSYIKATHLVAGYLCCRQLLPVCAWPLCSIWVKGPSRCNLTQLTDPSFVSFPTCSLTTQLSGLSFSPWTLLAVSRFDPPFFQLFYHRTPNLPHSLTPFHSPVRVEAQLRCRLLQEACSDCPRRVNETFPSHPSCGSSILGTVCGLRSPCSLPHPRGPGTVIFFF